jgi:DNA-binding transcriptional regulator WhiA
MQRISYIDAAKILGCTEKTVRNRIKKGLIPKASSDSTRGGVYLEDIQSYKSILDNTLGYSYKARFFQDQNIRSAYWAGFLMADGNISDDGRLQIILSRQDKSILENFVKEIDYDGKINDYEEYNKEYQKTYYKSQLAIRNKYWIEDFKQWGIIPRKTLEYIKPNIKNKYLGWYVKGLFDGDGSVNVKLPNNTISRIEIIGHPQLMNFLTEEIPIDCYIGEKNINWTKLYISGKSSIKKFYYWCNGDIYPRLTRKWLEIEEFGDI